MTSEDALKWCRQVGLRASKDRQLSCEGADQNRFFVQAPREFQKIVVFARQLITLGGEGAFNGGLILLQRWDIGSPQSVCVGWQIIEDVRRAHGDLRPLDLAPAQLFRNDEFTHLHSFLLQVMGFGWVADYVPSSGGFFVHFKDNGQMCFMSCSSDTLCGLRRALSGWQPTDEDPMTVKLKQSDFGERL